MPSSTAPTIFSRSPSISRAFTKTLDDLAELFTRRSEIRDLEERLLQNLEFHGIIGRSPAMFEVIDLAKKVARHYSNVLITGPTGSGKEVIARALHHMSPVGQERFAVTVTSRASSAATNHRAVLLGLCVSRNCKGGINHG